MRQRQLYAAFLLALLGACIRQEGVLMSEGKSSRPERDASYRLGAAERARIAPMFDADALEELLQLTPPAARASLLRAFDPAVLSNAATPSASGTARQALPDMSALTRVSDPVLQEVLERVWAPHWAHLSLEQLEKAGADLPGIAIALQRARARRGGS
jgi:hypothetical protein